MKIEVDGQCGVIEGGNNSGNIDVSFEGEYYAERMKEVNADLYHLLNENETGLYNQEFQKNKTVYAYVHLNFSDLADFAEAVGTYPFEEGGMKVTMFERTIDIDLNDIIEGQGHSLSSYKNASMKTLGTGTKSRSKRWNLTIRPKAIESDRIIPVKWGPGNHRS